MRLVTTGTSKHDWRVQRSEQSRQAPAANSVVVGRYGAMYPIESMVMKHLGDPQWSWGQLSERKQYVFVMSAGIGRVARLCRDRVK